MNKQQWMMMLLAINEIGRNANKLENRLRRTNILREVESIKNQIRQVIGQMG